MDMPIAAATAAKPGDRPDDPALRAAVETLRAAGYAHLFIVAVRDAAGGPVLDNVATGRADILGGGIKTALDASPDIRSGIAAAFLRRREAEAAMARCAGRA
jgi:hypothetical protein